jgi:hypothetical protein
MNQSVAAARGGYRHRRPCHRQPGDRRQPQRYGGRPARGCVRSEEGFKVVGGGRNNAPAAA